MNSEAEEIHESTEDVRKGKIDPNAARVAIDALKWMLGRMNSPKYGDSKQVDVKVSGRIDMVDFVKQLQTKVIEHEPERLELESDIESTKKALV